MFGRKKENKKDDLKFKSENYQMKDNYNSNNIYVANLEYVSSEMTPYGPMIKTTEQKYLFEKIIDNNKERYREVFTGFIAESSQGLYFDLPYVVNTTLVRDAYLNVSDTIPKYALLLLLDEVNKKGMSLNKTK